MNFLVVFASIFAVVSANYPKTVEEAHKIIKDHVNSYNVGVGNLCDKNTCCTISSTESCSISKFITDQTVLVIPGGETRCIFSTSTPFAFQVSF